MRPAIHLGVRFLDNVIDVNQYPLAEIEQDDPREPEDRAGHHGVRRRALPPRHPVRLRAGARRGRGAHALVDDESHAASEALAVQRGVFPNWPGSRWERQGRRVRNATTTTVAPTGTISIIANCSGGIEPLFSLAFWRQVLDGKRLPEVNQTSSRSPRSAVSGGRAGRGDRRKGDPQGCGRRAGRRQARLRHRPRHRSEWHIRMQAVFQRHCEVRFDLEDDQLPRAGDREDVRTILHHGVPRARRKASRCTATAAASTNRCAQREEAREGGGRGAAKLVPSSCPRS